MTVYELIDCLHAGHRAYVSVDEIAATISSWLAELGVDSPLAEDLGRAVCAGDWPTAHHVANYLSVEVAVAA